MAIFPCQDSEGDVQYYYGSCYHSEVGKYVWDTYAIFVAGSPIYVC